MSSVTSNSERGEYVGIIAFFQNASWNNNILHVSNVNDETRHNIPGEVSELSVPETHFDRQTHTHHSQKCLKAKEIKFRHLRIRIRFFVAVSKIEF